MVMFVHFFFSLPKETSRFPLLGRSKASALTSPLLGSASKINEEIFRLGLQGTLPNINKSRLCSLRFRGRNAVDFSSPASGAFSSNYPLGTPGRAGGTAERNGVVGLLMKKNQGLEVIKTIKEPSFWSVFIFNIAKNLHTTSGWI